MPDSRSENQAYTLARQPEASRSGTEAPAIRAGWLLRKGSRDDDDDAEYWDVVLLDARMRDIDLNDADQFTDAEGPVYPMVRNVAAALGTGLALDATVSILLNRAATQTARLSNAFEVLEDEDFDVAIVSTGEGCWILGSGSGGGTCLYGIYRRGGGE